MDRVGFQIPITPADRSLTRGGVGQISRQPVLGSPTRLGGRLVADPALPCGVSEWVAAQARRRAEHRLATYLFDAAEPE
ncbi:MAG: hypothetical protein ACRDRO_30910 [Pseudonocardiaceae bacterium]